MLSVSVNVWTCGMCSSSVLCVSKVCCVFLSSVCAVSFALHAYYVYVLCSKSHYIPAVRVNTLAKPVFISTTIAPASCNMIAITEFICKRDLWPSLWQLLIPPTPAGQVAT